MKKVLSIVCAALIGLTGATTISAKTASQLRIYINPGHGAWDSNSRPQNIVREVNGTATTINTGSSTTTGTKPDTTAFYESNTNLWKCLATVDKLKQYGLKFTAGTTARNFNNNICMSRIASGPYPVNTSNKTYDQQLSTICAEVNANNFDGYISVHSNANDDGAAVNYLSVFYRGYSKTGGDKVSGSISFAQKTFTELQAIKHHKWTSNFRNSNAIGAGVIGDLSFYNTTSTVGYLGALKHETPGFLAEGYFHTYHPARQRAMQRQTDRIEGYMYARGVADYFGLTKESTGDIYGVVRSKTEEFSHTYYKTYNSYSDAGTAIAIDKKKGINGATVKLMQNGATLKTFTTDNHYNGAFVFPDIAPGTYTVQISKAGYKTLTSSVTVTATKAVYPEFSLEIGNANELKSAPLNNLTEKWNFSDKRGTSTQKGYDATKIRNFCYNDGKLYCVYDHSQILVLNAQNGEKLGFLNNGDVVNGGTLKLCDVKAIDGKIIACNLASASNNEIFRLYVWDNDNNPAQLLKTVTDLRGCARLGDCMEISGSWAGDMYLTFCNDNGTKTQIVDMFRKNGANWNADVYNVLNDQKTARLGVSSTARAYKRDGGFWVDGFNVFPTYLAVNANKEAVAQYCMTTTDQTWGTGFNEFQWLNDKYVAAMIFNQKTSDSSKNFTGGRVRLYVNNEGEYRTPITVADYPADGLSDVNKNGNTTTGSWINTDSRTYLELWVNSTNQGICYYSYGNPPTHNVSPIVPEDPTPTPTITANKTGLNFSAKVGESDQQSIKITGANLNGAISVAVTGTDKSMFSVSTSSIAQNAGATTINVTYTPTEAGDHTAQLTLASTGATTLNVPLSATGISDIEFSDMITADKVDNNWTYCEALNNQNIPGWLELNFSNNFTRDIEFLNNKLYALNCKYAGSPTINIVDPFSGELKSTVNVSGVNTTARVILGGLASIDGKLLASNSATSAQAFRVYIWDNDASAPRQILEDSSHGGITVGDQVSTSGTLTAGYIWASNGAKVLRYTITNGTVNSTATEFDLGTNGAAGTNGSADVIGEADGSFWVVSQNYFPKYFAADGTLIGTLSFNDNNNGKSPHQGTAAVITNFGSRRYMAATTYVGTSNTILGGALQILDLTESFGGASKAAGTTINASTVGVFPSTGLGTTRNVQFQTAVTAGLTNDNMTYNAWGLIPGEGITFATYDGTGVSTGVGNVSIANQALQLATWGGNFICEGATIEVYNTSGALVKRAESYVEGSSLPVGIYVIRAVTPDGRSLARKVALTR